MRRLLEASRAAQSASDVMDEAFVNFVGINRTDGRCLDVVDQRGRITAGDLAREAGLTTGAVTAVVDRLEAAGLMRRRSDPGDRRKVLIELTPDAQSLAQEVYGPLAHAGRPYLEALSDQQVLTLIGFFETSRRINLEHAEVIRSRTSTKKVSLRYRLEQARMIKNEAKALLKTIKTDVKDLASVVIEIAGSTWEQDENGRWVERKN
ncbi:MAG: MarR family transcriptional regulator [Actinomycetota bacterium]|nr:MarR family transcriptional regulator [Actinomycetota bacterium]